MNVPYVIAGLTGIWTRDEVGSSQQIQKVLRRDPLALANILVFHHSDMCGGCAKAGAADLQTHQHQVKKFLF